MVAKAKVPKAVYFNCSRLKLTLTKASCNKARQNTQQIGSCFGCTSYRREHKTNLVNTEVLLAEAEKTKLVPQAKRPMNNVFARRVFG